MNRDKRSLLTRLFAAVFLAALFALSACASVSAPNHVFEFRPLTDSPNVRILDWQYSTWKPEQWQKNAIEREGTGLHGKSVSGQFPVGDQIYIKWQVPPSEQIHERRIDLKGLLPRSMEGKEILLMFRSGEPHVYLISRDTQRPCVGRSCIAVLSSDVEAHARSYIRGVIMQIYPGNAQQIYPPVAPAVP